MPFDLMLFSGPLLQRQAAVEIMKCNEKTIQYGLSLTVQQATELAETRFQTLNNTGRIELGAGAIEKIIEAFCDSPYIYQQNYVEMMHELTEIFYYFKNETLDMVSDDDLIGHMKESFDTKCQGSLELLKHREMEKMANNVRYGHDLAYEEEDAEGMEEEQVDEDE